MAVQVVVWLGTLLLSCIGSNSDEETLRPTTADMGRSGEAEGEVERDYGPQTTDHGPTATPDGGVARDLFVADQRPETRDLGPTTPDASPDAGAPPSGRADVNIFPGNRLAIFAGRFGEPEGILYSYDLTDPSAMPVEKDRIASTDVVLRYQEGTLYAIDRTNAAIYLYDSDFNRFGPMEVGVGTNPQDVAVLPDNSKGYITRLDAQNDPENQSDLLVFDPTSGDLLDGRDLTSYTTDNEDRLARAAQMVLVGADLYVALQDLSAAFTADTNGKVVVVDTDTDTVVNDIPLTGRNPADLTYSEISDRVYVANTGRYEPDYTIDLNTAFGGIEVINPSTSVSEGILFDDADLQGAVSDIRIASRNRAYVMTDFVSITPFDPEEMRELDTEEIYVSDYFFLPDFSLDLERGARLVVADEDVVFPTAVPAMEPIALASAATSIAFMP